MPQRQPPSGQQPEHDSAAVDPQADEVAQWVQRACAGDEQAFAWLVQRHMRAVHALALRLMRNADDADDIAQETFVRAWQSLQRYDPRWRFYTWLRTIATRLAWNALDKRRRRDTEGGERFEEATEMTAAPSWDPQQQLEDQEMRQHLQESLDALPEAQRLILMLRTQEGLSYAAIAEALDIKKGTVMSRLARARHQLRHELQRRRADTADGADSSRQGEEAP